MAFCPFTNDECRNDCVFNNNSCKLLKVCNDIEDIKNQTTDCSYIYSIYSKLDDIIREIKK